MAKYNVLIVNINRLFYWKSKDKDFYKIYAIRSPQK